MKLKGSHCLIEGQLSIIRVVAILYLGLRLYFISNFSYPISAPLEANSMRYKISGIWSVYNIL